jgi:hypothetical protein
LSITFGDKPAGCAATTSLRKTAQMSQDSEPKVVKVIEDCYVDDCVTGASTVADMKKMIDSIERITRPGGFCFKKWIMSGDSNAEVKLLHEKVLGICWNPTKDVLLFSPEINPSPKKCGKKMAPNLSLEEISQMDLSQFTRRKLLTIVNSIFDPLGLLSPITVMLKINMKNMVMDVTKFCPWK